MQVRYQTALLPESETVALPQHRSAPEYRGRKGGCQYIFRRPNRAGRVNFCHDSAQAFGRMLSFVLPVTYDVASAHFAWVSARRGR